MQPEARQLCPIFFSTRQQHMTDWPQRFLAFFISILIHGAIFFIVLPAHVITIVPQKSSIQVPVKFVVNALVPEPESPPPAPIPDKVSEKATPARPVAKPSKVTEKTITTETISKPGKVSEKTTATETVTKPESVVPAEPTSLPGDRSAAIVAKHTFPIYPKSALNQGLTGTVVADFAISDEGKPTRFRVISSSGHKILDDTFTQTVMSYYTFEPKRVMGKDLAGSIRLSYTFELEDQ